MMEKKPLILFEICIFYYRVSSSFDFVVFFLASYAYNISKNFQSSFAKIRDPLNLTRNKRRSVLRATLKGSSNALRRGLICNTRISRCATKMCTYAYLPIAVYCSRVSVDCAHNCAYWAEVFTRVFAAVRLRYHFKKSVWMIVQIRRIQDRIKGKSSLNKLFVILRDSFTYYNNLRCNNGKAFLFFFLLYSPLRFLRYIIVYVVSSATKQQSSAKIIYASIN